MIKTIPKQERHLMYCIMLAEAEENLKEWVGAGVCHMAIDLFNVNIYPDSGNTGLLPEIAARKQKPTNRFCRYWYDCTPEGWQKRIEILKQCIEETA